MNNILNTMQDIKDLLETRQFSEGIFDEKTLQQPCHSISSKIVKHIFFNSSGETKADSASIGKASISSRVSSPNKLYEITLKYISEFLEILLMKSRAELNFHINNADAISNIQDTHPNRIELNIIKDILNMDSFTLLNKKENPNFYKIDAIIRRFKGLVSILDGALRRLSKENLSKVISFYDENECQKCLMKYFPQKFFEDDYFRRTCSELYRFIRTHKSVEPNESNIEISFDNLKLFVYGISFPSSCAEDYSLHKAVFCSNLAEIRRICAKEKSPNFHVHIEQSDPVGVTPLMLAVLRGDKDAALILANHGANPKHRSYPYARTPLEEAIYQKNRGMIKVLLGAATNIKQTLWEENKKNLIEFLKKVPDFSFEMNWECDSKIIPFVKKVAPSDTYKIYKRGGSIRIDLSLLGWSKLKSIRGNSSIIFNGLGSEEGKLVMIDHNKKVSVNMLAEASSLSLENRIDELLKHEQMNSEVKAENVTFTPATNWKGESIKTHINDFECTKYIAKGTFSLLFTKRNVLGEINTKNFEHFEQYFNYIIQDPLWILGDHTGHINWNQSPISKIRHYIEYYQTIVKSFFEKEGKENGNDGNKGRKEADKMSIAQKKLLKNYTKNIMATIFMCENFPLNLNHFFPILEILSNVSPHIHRLKAFLERTLSVNKKSFPIKASIPIFFSLNAILTIKGFKFTSPSASLFEIETMLQKTTRKALEYAFREERYKTEGGSDEEHIQNRWHELLQHDPDDEVVSYTPSKFQFKENEEKKEIEPKGKLKSEKAVHPFFKKCNNSTGNNDFVDVFDSDDHKQENEDENLDDYDINEKCRNETLKMSSHGTSVPKTIMFIQAKFKPLSDDRVIQKSNSHDNGLARPSKDISDISFHSTIQNKKSAENIHSLKGVNNYKFMGNLNHHFYENEANSSTKRQTSPYSRNLDEMEPPEGNMRDLQNRKLKKYTLKKQNLMNNKTNNPAPFFRESQTQKEQRNENRQKSTKRSKHERIKSFDVGNTANLEMFYDSSGKHND